MVFVGGPTPGNPVAVVGIGVQTPAGSTPDELWAFLCAGRSCAEPFADPALPPDAHLLVARVKGPDPKRHLGRPQARRLDRIHLLATAAAEDALEGVRDGLPERGRCAVVCGIGYGAAATIEAQYRGLLEHGLRGLSALTAPVVMPSSVAAHLALRFGFGGPCHTVSTSCASGASAIGEGAELLRRGAADLVLAGGVDAMLTLGVVGSFLRLGVLSANAESPDLACRPFDRDRDGLVLAEGAGFLVLVRGEDAIASRWAPLGYVAGYAATCDAHHIVAPPNDGEGARRCMALALEDAGLTPGAIGHINAHGTSTRDGDRVEARAIRRMFGDRPPPVTSVKGSTGHMIGGSGAVEAIVTLLSLRDGAVPPVAGFRTPDPDIALDIVAGRPRPVGGAYALSNSFGFGGNNAALVLAGAGTAAGGPV